MRHSSENWARLESVIKWTNMTANSFAKHIGLRHSENLYQIKRGNNGISRDLADRVVEKFPEIDKLWLLTGEGVMFRPGDAESSIIPFFREDVESSITDIDRLHPSSEVLVPQLKGCDFAMSYNSTAMAPLTPAGAIVVLKLSTVDAIIPGCEYVVVCQKFVTLRIVRADVGEERVRLMAANNAEFDDMIINRNEIEKVYKVVGKIIVNK